MCLMLAGLRGIDEDIWKAARVDGIPMWKTYLFIIIPMMRPVFITTLVIIASGIVTRLRPGRGADQRRARHRLRSAGEICLRLDVPCPESRPGLRRLDDDAADGGHRHRALGLSRIRTEASVADTGSLTMQPPGSTRLRPRSRGPSGPKPRRTLSRTQHHALRHAVRRGGLLSAAALRDDRHIAQGHAGNPARQHLRAAARDHLRALGEGMGDRLHRPQLRRAVARLLEFGPHHRSVGDRLDRDRLGQRLRARQLALQGRRSVLHDPDRRRLHPLSGDDLSDRHRAARDRHLRHLEGPRHRPHAFSACRS